MSRLRSPSARLHPHTFFSKTTTSSNHAIEDEIVHRLKFMTVAALVTASTALSGCGGDADPNPDSESSTEAVSEQQEEEPAEYDASIATDEEKWAEYKRLMTESGLPRSSWQTGVKDAEATADAMCNRTLNQQVGGNELMWSIYSEQEKANDIESGRYFLQAYCPEQLPIYEEALTVDPPDPKGTYNHSCDYVLGDFTSYTPSGYRFLADVTLHNTGNVGTVDEVKAIWLQAGGGRVVETKTVRVPAGGRKRVGFTKPVGQNEIDLIQAVGYGRNCKVTVAMVDTFGPTQ
jgi:hypothetical protein